MRFGRVLALASAGLLLTPLAPAAQAAPGGGGSGPWVRDGRTEPVSDYTQAIRERVLVDSDVDSDGDGRKDKVEVRIIRPAETAAGAKVPVIFQPSPYYAPLNDVPNHDDVDRDDAATTRSAAGTTRAAEEILFAGYLDNYFVPRGYAVVFADSLGTGGSEGCPTSGGDNETQGMKAVVDWLNGRAPGTQRATWSTGQVGMIGVSYNGTLPNAVATTGVEGLETIVPIAAISSWYDYYRANGGVVAPGGYQGEDTDILAKAVLTRRNPEVCAGVMAALERDQDRVTGDYSRFWHERNYLRNVGKVRASVLAVHGLNDWNVKTAHVGQWWDALAARGVPRKIWLHQGPHTDPFNVRRAAWLTTLHRWFDHWLYDLDNGVMREPMADVETAPGTWTTSRSWPVPGAKAQPFFFGAGAAGQPGTLARLPQRRATQTFVDAPARTAEDLVAVEQAADPNRLSYLSAPLTKATRLSGTPRVTVRAGLDGRSPYLTALLVDYGPGVRFAGLRTLATEDCIAPGIEGDPGCFRQREYVTAETPLKIVSRGWLDVRNRYSAAHSVPVEPGRTYTASWKLQPQDHIFEAGHRIGVVLISTDRDYTLRYRAGTEVDVELGLSNVILPLAPAR